MLSIAIDRPFCDVNAREDVHQSVLPFDYNVKGQIAGGWDNGELGGPVGPWV